MGCLKGIEMNHEKLYKIDSMSRVRVWWLESTDEAYRTHSGLEDGKIVTSGWQYPKEKNVGRANATTVAEQVLSEVKSKYEHQMYQGKYAQTIEEAEKGAKFYECMLAAKYDAKKQQNFPYWSQPKLDGIRCLVSDGGMQSRNGKALLSSPHIRDCLNSFFEEHPGVILDGELYNHALKDDFEKIISLARKTKPTENDIAESEQLVEYHVYDVIIPGEELAYVERMQFIEQNIGDKFPMVKVVPSVFVNSAEEIDAKLGEYLEAGYEGQMLRERLAPYEHRRSKSLIKHKVFEDEEFEIVELIEGKGNWAGYCKSIVIRLPDGSTQQSGMRGTQEFAQKLLEEKDQYVGGQVTVIYQNKTSDGKLRFPVAKAFFKGNRDV
jgi:DNA ligase-1